MVKRAARDYDEVGGEECSLENAASVVERTTALEANAAAAGATAADANVLSLLRTNTPYLDARAGALAGRMRQPLQEDSTGEEAHRERPSMIRLAAENDDVQVGSAMNSQGEDASPDEDGIDIRVRGAKRQRVGE